MASGAIAELEAAAKVILAPPSLVTSIQRNAAEQVFLNFRKSVAPYGLCKTILETSTVDYVLFETANALKEALIREWSQLAGSEILELRQYLLEFTIRKPTLPPFVRERILQVIAVIVKRRSVSEGGEERRKILAEVEHLIMEGELPRRVLGCSIITALMQEYSVKSSDIGLPWETHFKTKRSFESTDLRRILELCVRALAELMKIPTPFPEHVLTLLKHLLSISESVFNWQFSCRGLPRRLTGIFESMKSELNSTPLKLTPQWKDFILDRNVVNLFFDVYWKIRGSPHLAHHALNCLIQLASLTGPILINNRTEYYTNYIESLIKLISSIEVLDREALGVSNIIRNVVSSYPLMLMESFPPEFLKQFLTMVTQLTCYFAEGAAHEESVQLDDCLYMEAFENLLKVWMKFLDDSQLLPEDFCQQAPAQIFNTYLKCHLAPPDGTRGTGRELDAEEIEEMDMDDRTKFRDQLQAVGLLARQVPSHSVPLLFRLLEARVLSLHSNLERIHLNAFNISDSNILGNLFEDLHWLILISGNVISMESMENVSETAIIPSEIMRYSIRQNAPVEVTLKVLASPHLPITEIPGHEKADDIIRLVAAVLRLSEVERKVVEAKLTHLLSPEVSSSILWFLKQCSLSYLLLNETYYSEISLPLVSAFGHHSEASMWIINFLLSKVESNLVGFNCEPAVTEGSIQLLLSLVFLRDKSSVVLKSEGFWRVVELSRAMDTRLLPSEGKRGLMKSFILGGAGLEDSSKREEYWHQILQPLQDKLRGILGEESFKKKYHDERIKAEMVDILENFIGVAQGAQVVTVQSLFALIAPLLEECVNLTALYSNYQLIIELILQLFCDCARTFLSYLTPGESRRFYQACLNIVQMYARSNGGKHSFESSSEEDAYQDIQLLMELLTCLLSKDFIDLCPAGENSAADEGPPVTAADVCLYGLNILMPLMTIDLLKFPTLCLHYYKMILLVCQMYPEKIVSQEIELLKSILSTVQIGLQSCGKDVNRMCCEFVQVLGDHIFTSNRSKTFPYLIPFLKMLLDMILCHQVDSDMLHYAGLAMFSLVCCYKEEYEAAAQSWINSQTDARAAERLAAAFTDLTANLVLSPDRQHRARFREAFDKFVVDVHGFILIK